MIGRVPATTPLAVPDESRTTEEGATAIAAGSDGNLWFTQYSSSKIGRMTPGGVTTYFPLPKGFENPEGITAGPDGALWYTALNPPASCGSPPTGPAAVPAAEKNVPGRDRGRSRRRRSGSRERRNRPDHHRRGGRRLQAPERRRAQLRDPGARRERLVHRGERGRIGRITTPPNATTIGAGDVNAGEAKVAGTVDGHSQPTDVVVEYGPTGAASNHTSPLHLAASAADQSVTIPLSRLSPSTKYRYRVVATNPTGSTSGAFAEFTTGPPPKCRIKKAKLRTSGTLTVPLTCTATSSIAAAARFVTPKKSAKVPVPRSSAEATPRS